MANVRINFIGLLKLFLDVQTITVDLESTDEAKAYVETHYGPAYERKLKSIGVHKKQSIWDSSVFLLNGTTIASKGVALKDGDILDLIPMVAGG